MRPVILDTSVIVSSLIKPGTSPAQAVMLARTHDRIMLSADIFAEYERVLSRPKFRRAYASDSSAELLQILRTTAAFVDIGERLRECRDPGDDMYLELALAAGADIIVSGDSDLLVLDPWRGVRILTAAAYVATSPNRG